MSLRRRRHLLHILTVLAVAVAVAGTLRHDSLWAQIAMAIDAPVSRVMRAVVGNVTEDQKLVAADGVAGDNFGGSVSLDGNWALVGAFKDDSSRGSAYLFEYSGGNWTERAKLVASDGAGSDQFGFSVSLDGSRALIGASNDGATGSAYLFEYDAQTGNWTEAAKLVATDGTVGDAFGYSVSLSGNRALASAPFDDDGGSSSGSAYVFENSGGNWSETAKLVASDGAAADLFGVSVSLDGNRALIGARGDDDGGSSSGSTYVFEESGGNWTETVKLVASDAAADDRFGYSVSLDGNRALVGADGTDGVRGTAYVFENSGGNWTEAAKLLSSDGAVADRFGFSVSLDGNRALIGAFGDDDGGISSGSSYLFEHSGGNWTETVKLLASDGAGNDLLGFSTSLAGSWALSGARGDDSQRGSAYFYDLEPPPPAMGTIVISKSTVGGNGNFTFTDTIAEPNGFALTGGGNETFLSVLAGTYTVTETELPANWALTTLKCADPDFGSAIDLGNRTATIDLDGNETVSCTFTNELFLQDLEISVLDSPDAVTAGQDVTYTVNVSNAGNAAATDVKLANLFSSGFSQVVAQSGCPARGTGGPGSCALGTIGAGNSTQVVFVGSVDSAQRGNVSYTGTLTSSSTEGSPGNERETEITTVGAQVDLTVTQVESEDPVEAGTNTVTYTVTVRNNGPSTANGVVIEEALTLPSGTSLDEASPSQGTSWAQPNWTVGTLSPNQTATMTLDIGVGASTMPGTDVIQATASVDAATETLVNTGDDSATVKTSVTGTATVGFTLSDSVDPVPQGDDFEYVLEVTNSGPTTAFGVDVTGDLPTGLLFVSSSDGCFAGAGGRTPGNSTVTCTFGDVVPSGNTTEKRFLVTRDDEWPELVSFSMDLMATAPAGISASDDEDTVLGEFPTVEDVLALPNNEELAACWSTNSAPDSLAIAFSEPMDDAEGAFSDPASYQLVAAGDNLSFDTLDCSSVGGDDVSVPLLEEWSLGNQTIVFTLDGDLADGQYELRVCGSLTDEAGLELDGDEDQTPGDDFRRVFRLDTSENPFANPHFDCSLDGWTPSDTIDTVHDDGRDTDGASDSGSALFSNPDNDTALSIAQCIPATESLLKISWQLYPDIPTDQTVGVASVCEFFDGADCTGTSLGLATAEDWLVGPDPARTIESGLWSSFEVSLEAPAETVSALCDLTAETPGGLFFDLNVDEVGFEALYPTDLFDNGFESGDTSAWSTSVGELP